MTRRRTVEERPEHVAKGCVHCSSSWTTGSRRQHLATLAEETSVAIRVQTGGGTSDKGSLAAMDLSSREAAYAGSGYAARAGTRDPVIAVNSGGPGALTLLAPHAVNHFREDGRRKRADRGTGSLVEVVSGVLPAYGLISAGELRRPEQHWNRLRGLVRSAAARGNPCLDLHGMTCDGVSAIDIGLGRRPTAQARALAEVAVSCGARLKLPVTINRRFAALSSTSLVDMLIPTGLSVLQAELCACLRPPRATAVSEQLLAWFGEITSALEEEGARGREHQRTSSATPAP